MSLSREKTLATRPVGLILTRERDRSFGDYCGMEGRRRVATVQVAPQHGVTQIPARHIRNEASGEADKILVSLPPHLEKSVVSAVSRSRKHSRVGVQPFPAPDRTRTPYPVRDMSRTRKVTITVRTALRKSKSKVLEVVSVMKTRVNGATNVTSMISQVAEQLFIADKNHLVLDLRYGMKEQPSADGPMCYARVDAGTSGADNLEDEVDPAAWPEGLPAYTLESVIQEAIRISTTVRFTRNFTFALPVKDIRSPHPPCKLAAVALRPATSNRPRCSHRVQIVLME